MAERAKWLTACLHVCLLHAASVAARSARQDASSSSPVVGLEPCTAANCKLPKCFCSGTAPPGGLTPKQVPQIVMLTFDDNVNAQVYSFQKEILNGQFRNPNGCPMTATFYVCHEYTDYYTVQLLHSQRNEIADHSITHRTPTTWWANASAAEWQNEVGGMRTILEMFGNIPGKDVHGFRAPFLQTGGDREFGVLQELGFEYESSMPTCKYRDPPMYPYTLDYASTEECMVPPCPKNSYPGLWEVPLVGLESERTGQCYSMVDAFTPTSVEDAYAFLSANFRRHYETNRAPFGIFMHAAWFLQHPNVSFPALERLLGELAAMDDVWMVSVAQMLDWMRQPQSLETVKTFAPFACSGPAPPPAPCAESAANNCHFAGDTGHLCADYGGVKRRPMPCGAREEHYMRTCSPCPAKYPWYGNPEGK